MAMDMDKGTDMDTESDMNTDMSRYDPLSIATKYVFFTGKGGVGKTSIACATAIRLAEAGRRVLIVSTDPASNLDDVFETAIGPVPAPVPEVAGLYAANLDPEEAARAYREKVVGPYRGILPDAAIVNIEEQLSGACTVEIAAFDEFAKLLGAPVESGDDYDHVLLDTAPTGHTLRLLQLPKAWSGFLEENTHGASCLGPLSGLGGKKELYADTVEALADPLRTTLVLVARADRASLAEAARASVELVELGIGNQRFVLNGLLGDPLGDPAAQGLRERQNRALAGMPKELRAFPGAVVPMNPRSLTGVSALGGLFGVREPARGMDPEAGQEQETATTVEGVGAAALSHGLGQVIDELAARRCGVVLTMGKGGVGKTTVAAAIALGLAERGLPVHLTTTDPAAHLELALGTGRSEGMTVSRIDPAAETERYRSEVLAENGAALDADALELLKEDLASPCTEEIAVFRAFSEAVAKSEDGYVVLDTAPTGHTLLLLDAAEAYHREVLRNSAGSVPEHVKELLPRLRDPEETHVLLVTLPEATPVLEAERLQEDLRRAGIHPDWWIVNQSWQAVETSHPTLRSRAAAEGRWVEYVRSAAAKYALLPWQAVEPVGKEALLQLTDG